MPGYIDYEKYGSVLATKHEIDTENADAFLMKKAYQVSSSGEKKDVHYKLYDIDGDGTNEMLMSYEAGVRMGVTIYKYDSSVSGVKKVKAFVAVNAVYRNNKKHYITVQQAESATAGFYTAYKMNKNGKLKKLVKYSFSGKKYKKNKKKISKKTFEKELTKYTKNGELLIKKKAPKEDVNLLTIASEAFYSKDMYFNNSQYYDCSETTIMQKGGSDSKPQDDFLAFKFEYDKIGEGASAEYSSEPAITRYILGPSVADPATGKTYREEDFEQMRVEKFACEYAPLFLSLSKGESGKMDDEYFDPNEVKNLTVSKDVDPSGYGMKGIKCNCYKFTYGDENVSMWFISEGANAGRISDYAVNDSKTNAFKEGWTFLYGEDIPVEPEWDPIISTQVSGLGVETNLPDAKNRKITVNDKADEALKTYAFTITANQNVAFQLFDSDAGQFYTYKADGTTRWNLPMFDYDEDEWNDLEKMINPPVGQMSYTDSKFEKGLFWEPKKK